jgi:predicted nucleotidyltransferase
VLAFSLDTIAVSGSVGMKKKTQTARANTGRRKPPPWRPTRAKIERVVREIAEKFEPQKIILFGSCARGRITDDSDVDLLVIMDTDLRPVDQAIQISREIEFPFPSDLLVRTPEQVAQRLGMGDPFMREIVTRGTVLYEADHARVD